MQNMISKAKPKKITRDVRTIGNPDRPYTKEDYFKGWVEGKRGKTEESKKMTEEFKNILEQFTIANGRQPTPQEKENIFYKVGKKFNKY